MRERSTIAVSFDTREELRKLGKKGQTYDELIQELIETKKNMQLGKGFERSIPSNMNQ